jgi:hypothetical protein
LFSLTVSSEVNPATPAGAWQAALVGNPASVKGRNPKTGTPVDVAPKRLPFFKASKNLVASINGGRKKKGSTESGLI